MASALAQPIFRTSSIEQGLHINSITDEPTVYHGQASDPRLPSPLPPAPMFMKDISRSSSGSTHTSAGMMYQPNFHTRSASLSQGRVEEYNRQQQHNRAMLPGLSTLASLASTKEPQMRSFPATSAVAMSFNHMSAVPTPGICGNNNLPPVCQNCETSTTPLWRRDESGAVLCNACGLFLKLHGRPRPISLKTDVIKSRNRVKSANQGPKKQMSLPASQSTDVNGLHNGAHRRVSQIGAQTYSQRSQSPISRTGTPSMHHDPNIAPQHMFDGVALHDHAFQTPALPHLGSHPSTNSMSGMHDRSIESGPLTYEELVASNNVLRTRVSELEVINMMYTDNENNLRRERDEALQAKEELKRRIAELEYQASSSEPDRPSKRARIDENPARAPLAEADAVADAEQ